jgi:hypothetical protein
MLLNLEHEPGVFSGTRELTKDQSWTTNQLTVLCSDEGRAQADESALWGVPATTDRS